MTIASRCVFCVGSSFVTKVENDFNPQIHFIFSGLQNVCFCLQFDLSLITCVSSQYVTVFASSSFLLQHSNNEVIQKISENNQIV